MSDLIGKEVYFSQGRGEDRIEKSGIVVDKVLMTDVVRDSDNSFIGLSRHDIYLVKGKDGYLTTVHPVNLIKIV